MGFIIRRLLRRFSVLGRLADLIAVAGMALRFAQRKGLIDDQLLSRFGMPASTPGPAIAGQAVVGGSAAWRIARRLWSARKLRRMARL